MLKVLGLWSAIFLLAGIALATASQYLITPIWPANFVAAFYAIKLRRYLNNYVFIWLIMFSSVMAASIVFDQHQPLEIQILMSGLCGIQVNICIFIYYWLIKNITRFTYKRTAVLILPCLVSTLIASVLFILMPIDGLKHLMFFDYFLEQIATGFAVICILYGLKESYKVSFSNYMIMVFASVGQYFISINPLFYNCFILPLVSVYFTIQYHFKRFVFVMGLLAFVCSIYLVLPIAGQYWKENDIYLFSHLSTYRVGIASFIIIFLLLNELQMRHRSLTRYLEKISFYDQLTGLKNRRYLHDKLLSRDKTLEKGAILLIDVDDFKKINDRYGHNVGDEVLKQIAKRIQDNSSNTRFVFRWGGEEFLILITQINDLEKLKQYCQHIIQNCQLSLEIEGHQLQSSVSIGVEVFENLNLTNYSKTIEKADQLLYQAKQQGKNRYILEDVKTSKLASL